MLNIPDAIKALYLADSRPDIRKNFRVSFPNGELPDVNSDQILQESVQLNESIMSQSKFRFGLAEAPQISFETIGVPNMMGMTIVCSHEIETTSLTASQISDIQSGTWDGELVLEADSDLGFGFFRIPLGTFIVNKCPRNQGAMTHRRVVADGADNATDSNCSLYAFERWKHSLYYQGNSMTYDLALWALGTLGAELGTVSASKTDITTYQQYFTLRTWTNIYQTVELQAAVTNILVTDKVMSYDLPDSPGMTAVQADFEAAWTAARADSVLAGQAAAAKAAAWEALQEYAEFTALEGVSGIYFDNARETAIPGTPSAYPVSPALSGKKYYMNGSGGIFVPQGFRVVSSQAQSATYDIIDGNPSVTTYTISPAGAQYPIAATGTVQTGYPAIPTMYSFVGAFPYAEIVTGLFELYGAFGMTGRNGGISKHVLDDSSPYSMPRSQYSELWFDEYDVSAIGQIIYDFNGSDGSETYMLRLGTGQSVYDLSGNAILAVIPTTQAEAAEMITTYFVPNIGGVDFTPIELSAKGLPWLEVGDAVEVITEDGETVLSYILERTLSGIQSLRDEITSTGGELISADAAGYGQ